MGKTFFQHEKALVETSAIGEGTRIWAFAHVLPGARIGRDCNICDHVFIENQVVIGDRVTIKCGVQIWDGVHLEEDVFIGPNATFTNDLFPRSKQYLLPEKLGRTLVKRGASIGANATILPGVVIGESAMVGAGAVVTRDVPPHAIVAGNPATIISYVDTPRISKLADHSGKASVSSTEVQGVTLHQWPTAEDMRGALTFAEASTHVPFEMKRLFLVYGVPNREVRGEHAHHTLQQFLVCVHGSCSVIADDGRARREFRLDAPSRGLYLPPLTWSVQYKYTADAVLLVLASGPYDAADYIRDYSEFSTLVGPKE
jgi:UDP-2-acetamido-3-amino-2,3-dideoxy-glucuronate N-acetyltransferase